MIIFLTSSPTGDLDGKYTCEGLDSRNGFNDAVRKVWRENARVLMISAFPDAYEINAEMKGFFHEAILKTGLSCKDFELWDDRILADERAYSRDAVQSFDVIILGGGHVPTQHDFFCRLNLAENIRGFDGIVIGISAGTMNCASVVYAQPEEAGEAVDPSYERFFEGLKITDINVLPHYQLVKDKYLDGMHLFNEISIPDSKGRRFISMPDGSYIVDYCGETRIGGGQYLEAEPAKVYGKAFLIEDGNFSELCQDGEVCILQ